MENKMENTTEQSTIRKIFGILEEPADQKWDEVDWLKIATQIYDLVKTDLSKGFLEDFEIAENMREIWKHLQSEVERGRRNKSLGRCVTCGADAYREFVFTGKPHMCKEVPR